MAPPGATPLHYTIWAEVEQALLVILENSTNGFTQCTTSHPREGFYFF